MPVYVDNVKIKFGRMRMCHMLADTLEELHAMADKLGLKREWFQNHGTPHYDICMSRRVDAIGYGCIPASRSKIVELIRKYRKEKT